MPVHPTPATAWLTQVGELQSAKLVDMGSNPAQTINQGL